MLRYLQVTQEPDGHWSQNMWLDGTPYWHGIQMDETALPILLVDLAAREGVLDAGERDAFWPMVRRAAAFLARNGPVSPQDRWEEDPGYSPFTIAAEIAALLVAADLADAVGEHDGRDVSAGDGRRLERQHRTMAVCHRHRTGAAARRRRATTSASRSRIGPTPRRRVDGFVPIKNRPPDQSTGPAALMVSLDALAFVRFGLRARRRSAHREHGQGHRRDAQGRHAARSGLASLSGRRLRRTRRRRPVRRHRHRARVAAADRRARTLRARRRPHATWPSSWRRRSRRSPARAVFCPSRSGIRADIPERELFIGHASGSAHAARVGARRVPQVVPVASRRARLRSAASDRAAVPRRQDDVTSQSSGASTTRCARCRPAQNAPRRDARPGRRALERGWLADRPRYRHTRHDARRPRGGPADDAACASATVWISRSTGRTWTDGKEPISSSASNDARSGTTQTTSRILFSSTVLKISQPLRSPLTSASVNFRAWSAVILPRRRMPGGQRAIWLMVPAAVVDPVLKELSPYLESGHSVVDGGTLTLRRRYSARPGTRCAWDSLPRRGGERRRLGNGAGILPDDWRQRCGGRPSQSDFQNARAQAWAPRRARRETMLRHSTAQEGYLHCWSRRRPDTREDGPQRHRVRAHGGVLGRVQYPGARQRRARPPQVNAETVPLRHPELYRYDIALPDVAEVWRRGSVIGSWLLDLTARALAEHPDLKQFSGRVSDSGEGRWTANAAIDTSTPAPVLTAALFQRFSSRGEDDLADRLQSAMRSQFGGHRERPVDK